VNLIGEHTDYNDGFVLPMAIDRATVIAAAARSDRRVVALSEGFGERSFSLGNLQRSEPAWIEYVKGVAWAMGPESLDGWDGFVTSDIPLGASLSSSAALEVGTLRAFGALGGLVWDPVVAALLAQRAENEWVGMNSGIMDQLVCTSGSAGHALLIDCRDLSTTPVPIPAGVSVVILDTSTRRKLTESRYNDRRAECEAAAQLYGVDSLRDLSIGELPDGNGSEVPVRRARHVVSENGRVLSAVEALRNGDVASFGHLMNESHESLRDDFEVSSAELNSIVEAARAVEGCLGARMTGGGFAGCAVALVETPVVESFGSSVAKGYSEATGLKPAVYVVHASDGVSVHEV
jgi:galactokinase